MITLIIIGLLYAVFKFVVRRKKAAVHTACKENEVDRTASKSSKLTKKSSGANYSRTELSNAKNLNQRNSKKNSKYSHNWLMDALKENTSPNMSFTLNRKYSFDDDPKSTLKVDESDLTNEASTSSEESPRPKRAQRNRKTKQHLAKQRLTRSYQGGKMTSCQQLQSQEKQEQQFIRALAPPLRQHIKLNLTESELIGNLKNYLMDESLMQLLGFPIEYDIAPNLAIIYKHPPFEFMTQRRPSVESTSSSEPSIIVNNHDVGLNPNKKSFEVNDSSDSGQGSGSSSPDFEINQARLASCGTQKECLRCGKGFYVTNDGDYVTTEHCLYHWGKVNRFFDGYRMRFIHSCCNRDYDAEFPNGCTANRVHVWSGVCPGINGPYEGFVRTNKRPGPPPQDGNTGVFALDCEMCFTGFGLELTKVSIVRSDGNLYYESFVRPERDIVDYNTRFSGITEKDLNTSLNFNSKRRSSATQNSSSNSSLSNSYSKTVKTLKEVQTDLLNFIFEDTILIGHAIHNDLKALQLIHKTVIDTSISFPHHYGLPFRRALKSLTKSILKRDIQQTETGHCSFEDSRACLELMLWRVRKDFIAQH